MELTGDEAAVLVALGEVWNAFCLLPVQHPADAEEFMRAIHAAQNIVAARVAVRTDPEVMRQPDAKP